MVVHISLQGHLYNLIKSRQKIYDRTIPIIMSSCCGFIYVFPMQFSMVEYVIIWWRILREEIRLSESSENHNSGNLV